MALAPVVATQLTDHSAKAAMLTINGADVLDQPGTSGNGYGVPITSIAITEAIAGSVSAMTFDIDDPQGVVPEPVEGDELVFEDVTNARRWFGGFVQRSELRPDFGGQGRTIGVRCQGYEILLDWAKLLIATTFPAGLTMQAAIQSAAAQAAGANGLRAFGAPGGGGSTYATPVDDFSGWHGLGTATLAYAVTIAAGTTLREALRLISRASLAGAAPSSVDPTNARFTVDYYGGLRAMADSATGSWTGSWATLTVDDGLGPNRSVDLRHARDGSSVVRGVQVNGANAAGTGFAGDGSGRPGNIAIVNDATVDTAAKLADAQGTYFAQYVTGRAGTLTIEDFAPGGDIHPGSRIQLTDAIVGAAGFYRITSIARTFLKSGRESWRLTYGAPPPRASEVIRRLTRATLS